MKIYTKIGDKGTTLLANGATVPKTAVRVEAYGAVDELNAQIALTRDVLLAFPDTEMTRFCAGLLVVQHELFTIGSCLAGYEPKDPDKRVRWSQHLNNAVKRLEHEIDLFSDSLEPLKNFILPGGHAAISQTHVARCVCRRTERAVLRVEAEAPLEPGLKQYFNRLSDWLFIGCRVVARGIGCSETIWKSQWET